MSTENPPTKCDTVYCAEAAEPGHALCVNCIARLEAALEAGADCIAAQG